MVLLLLPAARLLAVVVVVPHLELPESELRNVNTA